MRALTLQYHDVTPPGAADSSGFANPAAATYKLDEADFAAHVRAVSAVARHRPTADAPLAERDGAPPVLFTFDDGGASAHDVIAPLLEGSGWRGHFFVTTDFIGTPGFLSADQIRALRRRGHVIGAHSCSHPTRMARCDRATLRREWGESVRVLAELLGEPVTTASVPGGYYARPVAVEAAAAGIRTLFTSEPVARVERVDGCAVVGRYTLRRWSPPSAAAALAAGRRAPRYRQWLVWNAKKAAKRAAGDAYLRVWAALLRRNAPPAAAAPAVTSIHPSK